MRLRLGTRASALARWQAEWVAARLRRQGVEVELTPITTAGDRRQDSLDAIGGQGVFTKEIQLALLDGRIDLAVHSLKDLPTVAVPGLCLAAVPERGAPGDVLVSTAGKPLNQLSEGATVGTGSVRRRAQLLHVRPDLQMLDIRGNVDTRLRKLHAGGYDALVLAEAGLQRLGLEHEITQRLPFGIMLPAPGQGAMAVEARADDLPTRDAAAPLDHQPTRAAATAERTLLAVLEAGCSAPVAAFGQVAAGQLTLCGRAMSLDGAEVLDAEATAPPAEAESLGRRVAETLLARGAGAWIA